MKAMLSVGKALALTFWLVFGAALAKRVGAPFEQLIYLLAGFLALLHGAQLWLFSDLLSARRSPWLDRAQVLLFGIFHLYPLKAEQSSGADAVAVNEGAAHA
jgi:putative membrane protein